MGSLAAVRDDGLGLVFGYAPAEHFSNHARPTQVRDAVWRMGVDRDAVYRDAV
jgi:hypothetical protein